MYSYCGAYVLTAAEHVSAPITVSSIINSDVIIDVIFVIRISMQNHKYNKVENAFPIFKAGRLVRVRTDSYHNGHNKNDFAVSYVW